MRRIFVWAGSDLYSVVVVSEDTSDLLSEYQAVLRRLPTLEEDFGSGVGLMRSSPNTYNIDVSKVSVSHD